MLQALTHEKYLQHRPGWRLALGAYTSIEVPREGVAAIMPKVVGGLEAFGVERTATPGKPLSPSTLPPPTPRRLANVPQGPWPLVIAAVLVVAVIAGVAAWVFSSRGDQGGKSAAPATQTATGTPTTLLSGGSNQGVTQPLDKLKATLKVDPTEAFGTDTISISYSITNTPDYDFKRSNTEIVVLVGRSPGGEGVLLSDISQDIAPGATVKDTVLGNLAGTSPGRQKVYIMVGQRITSGSMGNMYPAQVAITVKA